MLWNWHVSNNTDDTLFDCRTKREERYKQSFSICQSAQVTWLTLKSPFQNTNQCTKRLVLMGELKVSQPTTSSYFYDIPNFWLTHISYLITEH